MLIHNINEESEWYILLFTYKAIKDGETIKGVYDAPTKAHVVTFLKAQNMMPVSISEGAPSALRDYLPKPNPKVKDMSIFCEQFCSLLRAGVPVLEAQKLLYNQTKSKSLKEALQKSINGVTEGESLADSMAKSPTIFPSTLVSLVKAGETSGSLDTSLERMSNQYKKDAEIQAEIKKALVYPIMVLIVAVLVIVFMLVFIVPKFMEMFNDIEIEMPKITLVVVGASNWIQAHWFIALLILVAIITAIVAFVKSKQGHRIISLWAIKIPYIKNFTQAKNASKIARTLSTLLTSGMTVIDALTILETTLSNDYYKDAIKAVREDVLIGQPMSAKFNSHPELFPQMLSHMISVGEDTGDITAMLLRTSEYYDAEVETETQKLLSMLQPVITIFLAIIVCVILGAVLMPMVTLYSDLGDAL